VVLAAAVGAAGELSLELFPASELLVPSCFDPPVLPAAVESFFA
jgi:hypothetical protein